MNKAAVTTDGGSAAVLDLHPRPMVQPPTSVTRRRRAIKHAARELNALHGIELPALVLVDRGDDWWHDTWSDRGISEREHAGRELARAGWSA